MHDRFDLTGLPPFDIIPDAWWAARGLLAGPLAVSPDRALYRARIRALLDAGVRTVIDLRTAAEPPGIGSLLEKQARADEDVAWINTPILNGAAPSHALLEAILDAIDASLARSRGVYVHCAGGLGRTGTVIACWWIRQGRYEPEEALAALTRHREGLASAARPSPETSAQYRLVRAWRRGA